MKTFPTPKDSLNQSPHCASALNHLSHGGTARSHFTTGEQPAHYLALLESAFAEFKPFSNHDAAIVVRSVQNEWLLRRRESAADNAEAALFLRQPNCASWSKSDLADMTRFARYKTEAARAYDRSLHCLKTIKPRPRDPDRWQLHLQSAKKKLEIHIERFEMFEQRRRRKAESDLCSSVFICG